MHCPSPFTARSRRTRRRVLEGHAAYLRPTWLADLHNAFGTAIAETITADPAFTRLVAAIDSGDPSRWTPLDLLHVAHEHLRGGAMTTPSATMAVAERTSRVRRVAAVRRFGTIIVLPIWRIRVDQSTTRAMLQCRCEAR
jgi:hypothetical protein